MKYATKRNLKKLIKIYKDAYKEVKDMSNEKAYLRINELNLGYGICHAYGVRINMIHISDEIFSKEFEFKESRYKWKTPMQNILLNRDPKKALIPRIKHLEKLLNEKSHKNIL